VIGSDYGALGDRIENGINGLKVPPRDTQAWVDAIRLTISDSAFRQRITQGVRPPDSIGDMAAHYAELYREVIQRSKTEKAPGTVPATAISCSDPVVA
jgi:glycosyltransferase involved in cell wall biosynthesis